MSDTRTTWAGTDTSAGAAKWHDPDAARHMVSVEIKAPMEILRHGFRFTDCLRPIAAAADGVRRSDETARPADVCLFVMSHPIDKDDDILAGLGRPPG